MKKYRGVFPALYACYDAEGRIHPKGVRQLTSQLCAAGVGGIYVNGLCGECGVLSVMEKAAVLENVMAEAAGRVRVICRVTCAAWEDTRELCRLSSACGADAVVALPQEEGQTPEETMDLWQRLADIAGETDMIVGPWGIPVPEEEKLRGRIRAFAESARVSGILMRGTDAARRKAVRDLLGGEVSVIRADPCMEVFSAFSEGLDAFIGIYSAFMPEVTVRLESSLRYAFPGRAMSDQALISGVMDTINGCGAPLDTAKYLLWRLRNVECGPVRPPLPRMSESDRETAEKCLRMLEGFKK